MKQVTFSLILSFIFITCKSQNIEKLYGTWKYSYEFKTENKFAFETLIIKSKDSSQIEKIKLEKPKSGTRNFYLVFNNKTTYTEIKSGIGMQFKYKVSNDTIYQIDKPMFKLISVDSNKLIIEKIDTKKNRIYFKSKDDLSKCKIY